MNHNGKPGAFYAKNRQNGCNDNAYAAKIYYFRNVSFVKRHRTAITTENESFCQKLLFLLYRITKKEIPTNRNLPLAVGLASIHSTITAISICEM